MRVIGLTLVLVFVCASFPVAGQDQSTALVAASDVSAEQVVQKPAGPPPTPAHTGIKAMLKGLLTDFGNLPSKQNLFIAGVGGGLALAAHPADDHVNAHLVGKDWAKNVFTPGEIMGESPTLLGVAATIYAVGRLKDEPKVSHVGMDLLRSIHRTRGTTVVLVTHDAELAALADARLVLRDGRVVEQTKAARADIRVGSAASTSL